MCSWTLRPPSVWSSAGLCSGRIAAVSSRSSRRCCESEHLSDSEPLRCCGSRPESEPSVSTAELLILQDKTIRPTLTANKAEVDNVRICSKQALLIMNKSSKKQHIHTHTHLKYRLAWEQGWRACHLYHLHIALCWFWLLPLSSFEVALDKSVC